MKVAHTNRPALISIVLVILFLVPRWAAAQTTFDRIVVFGASLSDPGNAFALRGGENTPPYDTLSPLLVPGIPYTKGGHHFTNGATWIEQYGRSLGLAADTQPAFRAANPKASNYAVGAARAREDGINANLSFQVSTFLHDFQGTAPSDALYVLEMGGNDVRDALEVYASGHDGSAVISDAITSIGTNMTILYAAGARKFLVWNVPDVGLTPALHLQDQISPGAGQFATLLTSVFNLNLDNLLGELGKVPGIDIAKFDMFQFLRIIVANPESFGLSVADRACIMPNTPPFECKSPDEYLFWDGIHPTKAVHAIVAQRAAAELAN